MASTPPTVVPFVAYTVPRDRAQARTWARRQIEQSIDAFVATARDPAASLTATTAAALDVLIIAAAFLARAKPAETAECLDARLYGFDSDFTQDRIGDATAELFVWVLKPLITEAARSLRIQRLAALEPYLSAYLERALASYLRLDPDLHRVPIRQLCQAIYESTSSADPQETVEVLSDMHDLIRPAIAAVQSPLTLAAIITPPTEFPADITIEIHEAEVRPATEIDATIAQLKARRTTLDPTSERDELHATWIAERLDELEGQQQAIAAMNASIRRKRDEEPSKR